MKTQKTSTEEKWSEFILKLYLKMKKEKNFKLSDFVKEHKVSGSLVVILKKNKFIKNYGNSISPEWNWVGIEPTRLMVKKVISEARAYNKKITESFKFKKQNLKLIYDSEEDKNTLDIMYKPKDKIIYKKKSTEKKQYEVKLFFGLFKIYINQI